MKDYTLIALGFVLFVAVFVNLPSDFEVAKGEAESVEYLTDQWISDSLRAANPDWSAERIENEMFGAPVDPYYRLELYEDSIYIYNPDNGELVYVEDAHSGSGLAEAMIKDNE